MMDFFGLDVVYHGKKQQVTSSEKSEALNTNGINLLQHHINNGQLGCKSGQGFYHYPEAVYAQDSFLENANRENYVLLATAVIHAAMELDQNGICATQDINRAWQVAMQLEDGPFDLLNKLSAEALIKALNTLAEIGLITSDQQNSALRQAAKYATSAQTAVQQ